MASAEPLNHWSGRTLGLGFCVVVLINNVNYENYKSLTYDYRLNR